MKKTSLKLNIIYNTLYQLLRVVIPFLTAPYVSRVLGASNVGIYSYTNSWQTYFAMFAALGTVSYGTREIAKVRDDFKERSKIFWEIELLSVITTTAILLIWIIFSLLNKRYQIYYFVLSFSLLSVIFDISWFYAGIEEFKFTVKQNTLFKIISTICIFAFVKTEKDLLLYILILSLSMLFGNMSMWIYLPKFVSKFQLKKLEILKHFKSTLVYFIPTISASIYTVLDKTLLGIITNDSFQNGYYEQATKIIELIKSVTFIALNKVMESRASYLYAQNKIDEIKLNLKNSLDFVLFIAVGATCGLIGISRWFVPWFFGEGYDQVVLLLSLLATLVTIVGISNCISCLYYTPFGKRGVSAQFLIVGAVVNLVLNLILIPKLAAIGAVIGSIVAEMIITILFIICSNNFASIRMIIELSWKKVISGIIMTVVIYAFAYKMSASIMTTCIQTILGASVYILLLVILNDSIVKFAKKFIKR